MWDVFKSTVKS